MHTKPIVRSSILQALSFVISVVAVFFLTPFIIGKLGDHKYGLWILITTITNYFALSEFGISSAVQNHLSLSLGRNDYRTYARLFSNAIILYLAISGLLVLITVILAGSFLLLYKNHVESSTISAVLFAAGCSVAVSFLFYPYTSVLTSHIRFDITAYISIFQIVFNGLLTFVSLSLGYGLLGLAIVGLTVALGSGVLLIATAKRQMPPLKFDLNDVNLEDIKSLLTYSAKTFMIQLSDILRFKSGEIVTGSLISVNMVAHYSIANRVVSYANGFSMRFMSVLNPLFAGWVGLNDIEKLRSVFLFSTKIFSVFSLFLFACLLILGKSFIVLWIGEGYGDTFMPMLLLGGAFMIARMQGPAISLFYATNTHQYFLLMNLFEGVLVVMLSVVFVKRFQMGINGVALSALIPIIFTKLIVQPMLIHRVIKIDLKAYAGLLLGIMTSGFIIYGLVQIAASYLPISSYLQIAMIISLLFGLCLAHLFIVANRNEQRLIVAQVRNFRKMIRGNFKYASAAR